MVHRASIFSAPALVTALVTGVAVVAVLACGACSSLPDLHFVDGDGGGGEGGLDGAIDPNCKPSAEICDDGIDNDCDGRIDCADSDCTQSGFSCRDVPQGWTPVLFAASSRPGCPSGAPGTDLKVSTGDGTASCNCSCTAVGGSCTMGSFTVTTASDSTCTAGATTKSVPVSSGSCTPLPSSVALSTRAMVTPPTGPTSCTAGGTLNGALTDGRLCPVAAGAGCGANQSCTTRMGTGGNPGLSSCVSSVGRTACPTGYSRRSTVGTAATDTRACSGCACGAPSACSGGSVSLYDSSMCKTFGSFHGAEGIDATCSTLTPNAGFTATHFKAMPPTGGCGMATSQATASGSVAFENERTICCR